MPRRRRPTAAAQGRERLVELAEETAEPERGGAGGGQLQRQREAVEPPADLGDELCGDAAGAVRVRICRAHAVGEKRGGVGRVQRFDPDDALTVGPERLAAGDEQVDPVRSGADRLDQPGHLVRDVLAVVEHQELAAHGEQRDDPVGEPTRAGRRRARVRHPQCGREHRLDVVGAALAELDQHDAVVVTARRDRRHVQGQPRLADTARTAERDDPVPPEQVVRVGDSALATDEGADRHARPARRCRRSGRRAGAGRGGRARGNGKVLAQHPPLQVAQLR